MRIAYLDGPRFFRALLIGAEAISQDERELNRINVFPVPDGDTGTNLVLTLNEALADASVEPSLAATSRSIADAALVRSRGNAGFIFAQFLYGFSEAVENRARIQSSRLVEIAAHASRSARLALAQPVDGTLITVMEDWARGLAVLHAELADLADLIPASLEAARESLRATPRLLPVLARAGVVDAGGQAFVVFLQGVARLIRDGWIETGQHLASSTRPTLPDTSPEGHELNARYCSEALVSGPGLSPDHLRQSLASFGTSILTGGSHDRVKVHVHTDRPAELFRFLGRHGAVGHAKVDDMKRQMEATHARKSDIALVTDSACDLPQELLDRHQVHMVPIRLQVGDVAHLDKLTLLPDELYSRLPSLKKNPTTSQPPAAEFQRLFSFLAESYDSVVAIHLSRQMSGTWSSSHQAASELSGTRISVLDSRHLCVSQGLLVLKAAEAIEAGLSHDEVVATVERAVPRAKILVGVRTLKHMIRGGRISHFQGALGRILNLKPIISVDSEGRGTAAGRAFGFSTLLRRICQETTAIAEEQGLWKYAVAHAHAPRAARRWSQELTLALGQKPAYVMDVSPVIGIHAGPGALAVGLLPPT